MKFPHAFFRRGRWRIPMFTTREGGTVSVTMATNQQVDLSLKGVGVAGGDTTQQFVGHTTWSEDGAGVISLVPDAAGLLCKAVALGVTGTSTITLSAVDPNGNAFTATVVITVIEVTPPPLEATDHIEIVAGTPADQ